MDWEFDSWWNDFSFYDNVGYVITGVIALWIIFKLYEVILAWVSYKEVAFYVSHKERISHNGRSYYLIFCDEEVLMNVDAWYFWKFNSSDVYRDLEIGRIYRMKVSGFRIPIFSNYRNIIKVV